jgi:hypothetical protein
MVTDSPTHSGETADQRCQFVGGALDAVVGPVGQAKGTVGRQVQLR